MPSGNDLSIQLWWAGEAKSYFVYYLTGALFISFLAAVKITQSLSRSEPQVIELPHVENVKEVLVSYIVSITTALNRGSSCPKRAKVFMQCVCKNGISQQFTLHSNTGGKEHLQRGSTNLYLFKIPMSLGCVKKLKLIVSGLTGPLQWKISKVKLFDFGSLTTSSIPIQVTTVEVLDCRTDEKVLVKSGGFCSGFWLFLRFHQWFSAVINSIRFGAFTDMCHVVCLFTCIYTMMLTSEIAYIYYPRPYVEKPPEPDPDIDDGEEKEVEEQFLLNHTSLLYAGLTASFCSFVLVYVLEFILRCVRSQEKKPGNAFYSILNQRHILPQSYSTCKKRYENPMCKPFTGFDRPPFFLKESHLLSPPNIVKEIAGYKEDVPNYIKNLLTFLSGKVAEDQEPKLQRRRSFMTKKSTQSLDMLELSMSNDDLVQMKYTVGKKEDLGKKRELLFIANWQQSQKKWARDFVKSLYMAIKETRQQILVGKLITQDKSAYRDLTNQLQLICQDVLSRICTAYLVQMHGTVGESLKSKEMSGLLFHLAVETVVLLLTQIFKVLIDWDNSTLPDLVLHSHTAITSVEHAADAVAYFDKYYDKNKHLLENLHLQTVVFPLHLMYLYLCYCLVNKHDMEQWTYLKRLTAKYITCLDEDMTHRLLFLITQNEKNEDHQISTAQRLCSTADMHAKEELWREFNCNKYIFLDTLIKQHLVLALKAKLDEAEQHKRRFIKVNKLALKPKSRVQKRMELRRKAKSEPPHEVRSKAARRASVVAEETKAKKAKDDLDKMMAVIDQHIENRQYLYETLSRTWVRQGVKLGYKWSRSVARSVLIPNVRVGDDDANSADEEDVIKFNNFLHFKRVEKLLAAMYDNLMAEVALNKLNTIQGGINLQNKCKKKVLDKILMDIIIEVDTLPLLLFEKVDLLAYSAYDIEPNTNKFTMEQMPIEMLNLARNASMSFTPRLSILGSLSLAVSASFSDEDSDTYIAGLMQEVTEKDIVEVQKSLEEVGPADVGIVPMDRLYDLKDKAMATLKAKKDADASGKPVKEKWSNAPAPRKGRRTDLSYCKGVLQWVAHYMNCDRATEELRDESLQQQYIAHCKKKMDYQRTVRISNIVDSYFLIEEGDDTKVLTKAGLYQLEHLCMGEAHKPLPGFVKTFVIFLMVVMIFANILIITIMGRQFTTTELQEWVCYFLSAMTIYGFGFEPLRAAIISCVVH